MNEIRFYKSPWKTLRLLLLCSPFIILSSYDIFVNHSSIEPVFLNWCCLCFFGLGLPISIFHLFDRRPQIIINEIGVFDRMAYKDIVNWELIRDAYTREVYHQTFVCLVLDEKAIPLLKNKSKRKNLSKAWGFQEVNLSLGQISGRDQARLIKIIGLLVNADLSKRKEIMLDAHQ
jgi:hypothetical protein